jgi:hypothetical protein
MSGIPFIPGSSSLFRDPAVICSSIKLNSFQKNNFTRSQTLSFRNGVASFEGGLRPQTSLSKKVPADLVNARSCMKFDAYFVEPVHVSQQETERIRYCVIYLHLEDESITVSEPKVKNSGLTQGALIKRHRIQKEDKTYFSLEDFRIGETVTLYGKSFTILDADQDTKVRAVRCSKLPLEHHGEVGTTCWGTSRTSQRQIHKGKASDGQFVKAKK